jgi:hypothetical protein
MHAVRRRHDPESHTLLRAQRRESAESPSRRPMIPTLYMCRQYQVLQALFIRCAVQCLCGVCNSLRGRRVLLLTLIRQEIPQGHLLLLLLGRCSGTVSKTITLYHHQPAALVCSTIQHRTGGRTHAGQPVSEPRKTGCAVRWWMEETKGLLLW